MKRWNDFDASIYGDCAHISQSRDMINTGMTKVIQSKWSLVRM